MKWTEDYIKYKHFTIENNTVKLYKNETDYVVISLPSTPDSVDWSDNELDIWCNGDLRTYFGPTDYMIIRYLSESPKIVALIHRIHRNHSLTCEKRI
jgi:hypothetical protein